MIQVKRKRRRVKICNICKRRDSYLVDQIINNVTNRYQQDDKEERLDMQKIHFY